MQLWAIIQILILLTAANGAPVITKRIFGGVFSYPIDGGLTFVDGKRWFGSSKTVRGLVVSIFTTSLCAPLIGLNLEIGLLVGITAMLGDLISSFIKRRLDWPPSSKATGLDQIPESLLPFIACRSVLSLTTTDILFGTAAFLVGEVLLSRVLFLLQVRDRPY